MNYEQRRMTEIFSIIDREILTSDLEASCHVEALLESKGNYDLMISRYFLKRVKMLQEDDSSSRIFANLAEAEFPVIPAKPVVRRSRINRVLMAC